MATVAKFRCTSIVSSSIFGPHGDVRNEADHCQVQVKLEAVGGPENESWSKWTPVGELTMSITNPAAARTFETDVDYVIEIRKAQPQKARS